MPEQTPQFFLTVSEAADQWRRIRKRSWPSSGKRQVNFEPVEVIVSLALLTIVDPSTQGGSDWSRYHPELRRLSELCRRSPGSFAEKERNLLGTRPNAGRGERALLLQASGSPTALLELWDPVIQGARLAGIGADALPDYLDSVTDGVLLGQDELVGDWESHLGDDVARYQQAGLGGADSERAAVTMARIGQHRFARSVGHAYRQRCGFCGMHAGSLSGSRLLVASHIKPWRDSSGPERWDPRNGIAACPTHDAAFDTGLLTVTEDGRIHTARLLREAAAGDRVTAAVLSDVLRPTVIPTDADTAPGPEYLRWHHRTIWRNGVGALSELQAAEVPPDRYRLDLE